MLVVFLPIFVVDTKIISDYNFGAPLINILINVSTRIVYSIKTIFFYWKHSKLKTVFCLSRLGYKLICVHKIIHEFKCESRFKNLGEQL